MRIRVYKRARVKGRAVLMMQNHVSTFDFFDVSVPPVCDYLF